MDTVTVMAMVISQLIVGIKPTLNNGSNNIRLPNQQQNWYDAYGSGMWMVIFFSQIIVV